MSLQIRAKTESLSDCHSLTDLISSPVERLSFVRISDRYDLYAPAALSLVGNILLPDLFPHDGMVMATKHTASNPAVSLGLSEYEFTPLPSAFCRGLEVDRDLSIVSISDYGANVSIKVYKIILCNKTLISFPFHTHEYNRR